MVNLDSTAVLHDTAHSKLKILVYVYRLHWRSCVLQLTVYDKSDDLRFSCSEVTCIPAHFEIFFQILSAGE